VRLRGRRPKGKFRINALFATGYTLEKCRKDIAVLQRALEKYPVGHLGEWTWVLVRSEDWEAIVTARGLNPDSPAFTYYAGKQTFFEEALVTEVPGRNGTLLVSWGMSMESLLDFAIAHELGHALCNEKDEGKAERVARLLRERKTASCDVKLQAKRRRGEDLNRLGGHINSDWAQDSIVSPTIPFELVSDFLVVVKGQIGDLDGLKFIIDSGATRSVIDRKLADRLRLQRHTGKVMNFDRLILVEWADIPDLRIGSLRSEALRVMVVKLAEYSEFAKNVDGADSGRW
jgi:hypothetical protein